VSQENARQVSYVYDDNNEQFEGDLPPAPSIQAQPASPAAADSAAPGGGANSAAPGDGANSAAPNGNAQQASVGTQAAAAPAEAAGLVTLQNAVIALIAATLLVLLVLYFTRWRTPRGRGAPASARAPAPAPDESRNPDGLRDIVGDMKRQLNTLQSSVDMLDGRVAELESAGARSGSSARAADSFSLRNHPEDRAASYAAPEPASAAAPVPTPVPAPAPVPAQRPRPEEVDKLVGAYAVLMASSIRSRDRFDDFFRAMQDPHVFVVAPDGASLEVDDEAEPLIAGGVVDGRYVVFPAFDFVSNFATLYNAERAMPPELRAAFDFTVDDSRNLVVESPAILAPDGSRYHVVQKGRLAGLIS
jgi:hypothetical protein